MISPLFDPSDSQNTPVPQVPVSIYAGMSQPRTGRVVVAGELLTASEARGLAGKLLRAADALGKLVEAT